MKYTILEHYLFNDRTSGDKLLALGDGSLFNHAKHPNIDYRVAAKILKGESEIRFMTGHSIIQPDEELCISYGSNLWFHDADGEEGGLSSNNEDETDNDFLARLQI
jgi:SET domain-containing protein